MGYRDFVEDSDGDDAELEELQAVRFGVTASLGGHLTPGVISHEQWKDHTLFLIDASPSMCSRHPSDSTERTFLQIALQAVLSVLSRKLTRAKDKIGILLFGTRETKRTKDMTERPHVYALLDIQVPDVQDINRLEKLAKNLEKMEAEIGSSDEYLLSDAFWASMNMFDRFKKVKEASRRVFIITNQDNPNASVRDAQRVARNRAKDLRGNGIQLGIFGLQGGEKLEPSFQLETFYSSLPGIAPEDWEGEELNGTIVSTPKDLVETISIKDNYRKTAFRIPFSLAPGLEVGIEGYPIDALGICNRSTHSSNRHHLVFNAKKPNPVYLEEKSNRRVETITRYTSAATGEIIKREEMKAAYMYGGEQAVFETKEVDKMKYFGDPGLVLLGFKPRETLKFKLNLRNACFVTPNEELYTGSTCLLSNLAQIMIDKGQIGIARLISLKRSLPRLVAILPQVPSLNPSSTATTTPLGLHLIYLPYADDIRHIDSDLAPVGKLVSPDLIQDMKEVIDALKIDTFIKPNPELGRFYAGLRSVALDLDEMEEVEDEAKPDNEWIQTEAGDQLRRVNEKLNAIAPAQPKRPLADYPGASTSSKRAKKTGPLTLDQVTAAHTEGRLKAFTVPQLKEFLLSRGVKKIASKKDDLLDQVVKSL